jgi:hypothetical protein
MLPRKLLDETGFTRNNVTHLFSISLIFVNATRLVKLGGGGGNSEKVGVDRYERLGTKIYYGTNYGMNRTKKGPV